MRIAFLGTPEFAVAPLDALAAAGHELVCVVAQPDRPAGRGGALRAPATKRWAEAHGVPVLQPEKVRDGRLAAELRARAPEILVVVAYGRILGQDLLDLAPHGAVNVHASLLPRWRGAAPIQWSIAAGDAETGVTLMRVELGLDSGPILLQRALAIAPDDTSATLHDRLARLGAEIAVEGPPLLAAGRLTPVAQDLAQVTEARVLTRDDGRLDFARTAPELDRRVRAFTPWPGAFTTIEGTLLKIHAARPLDAGEGPVPGPGEVRASSGGLVVGCAGGALLVTEAQLEGRRRLAAGDLARGLHLAPGAVLGR